MCAPCPKCNMHKTSMSTRVRPNTHKQSLSNLHYMLCSLPSTHNVVVTSGRLVSCVFGAWAFVHAPVYFTTHNYPHSIWPGKFKSKSLCRRAWPAPTMADMKTRPSAQNHTRGHIYVHHIIYTSIVRRRCRACFTNLQTMADKSATGSESGYMPPRRAAPFRYELVWLGARAILFWSNNVQIPEAVWAVLACVCCVCAFAYFISLSCELCSFGVFFFLATLALWRNVFPLLIMQSTFLGWTQRLVLGRLYFIRLLKQCFLIYLYEWIYSRKKTLQHIIAISQYIITINFDIDWILPNEYLLPFQDLITSSPNTQSLRFIGVYDKKSFRDTLTQEPLDRRLSVSAAFLHIFFWHPKAHWIHLMSRKCRLFSCPVAAADCVCVCVYILPFHIYTLYGMKAMCGTPHPQAAGCALCLNCTFGLCEASHLWWPSQCSVCHARSCTFVLVCRDERRRPCVFSNLFNIIFSSSV